MAQKNYKPHYEHLKNKWTEKSHEKQKTLWRKHRNALRWISKKSKHMAIGTLGSIMLLASPITVRAASSPTDVIPTVFKTFEPNTFLIGDLYKVIPKEIRPLLPEEEERVASLLTSRFNITVRPDVGGLRLNRAYGLIGAEQHLARFSGDTIYTHFADAADADKFAKSGMAPGRGAWGYFADSHDAMTEKDIQREKYYIAVQTFLAPDYNTRLSEYRDFFKFRKMLVVNPQNGNAIVCVIGDAGPAEWTGKHLGGSPEVMAYLQRVDGSQKGPVLYFFIDDPGDSVPLGPISIVQ